MTTTGNHSGTVADRGRGNDAGNTTGSERGAEGFVRKRVRTEYGEATLFWRNANAEVRTESHLPSA